VVEKGPLLLLVRLIHNCNKQLLAWLHLCLVIHMELGSQWMVFHEILCWEIFTKICQEKSYFVKTGPK
jgi:hypothetical protein